MPTAALQTWEWFDRQCRGRRFGLWLAAVTGLALILRALLCLTLADTMLVREPPAVTDMATYLRLARDIRAGQWPACFDYQPFYYTIFLPLALLLAPAGSLWPILLGQTLLGSAAVWLTGWSAARLYGRRAGILAALLLALSQFHLLYTPFVLLEVLQSFWMAAILAIGLLALRHNHGGLWAALGLTCAASTLTRGNALLFMPGLLLFCLWRNRRTPWRGAALMLMLATLFWLPQLPYAWRNYRATGRWHGPSIAQDKVLALGNTPEAPPGGLEYPLSYHQWCAAAENPNPQLRISVTRRLRDRLRHDTIPFLELKFRTLLLFWDHREIPNNISITQVLPDAPWLKTPVLLRFAVLGSLGLLGCLLTLRRPPSAARLWLLHLIAAYCLSTVAFYMLARFRIGVLPLLAVAGGGAIRLLAASPANPLRQRQHRLLTLLAAAIAVFTVNIAYEHYSTLAEPAFMRRFRPDGMILEFNGIRVVYDHGPLNFGGTLFHELDDSWLVVEKNFRLPESWMPDLAKYRATVMVRVFRTPGSHAELELQTDGHTITTPRLVRERMTEWYCFDLPPLSPPAQGKLQLLIRARRQHGVTALAFDTLRQYGRTRIRSADNSASPAAELTAELHLTKPAP